MGALESFAGPGALPEVHHFTADTQCFRVLGLAILQEAAPGVVQGGLDNCVTSGGVSSAAKRKLWEDTEFTNGL